MTIYILTAESNTRAVAQYTTRREVHSYRPARPNFLREVTHKHTEKMSVHYGPHKSGYRHTYDHAGHRRYALVLNQTSRILESSEVRGILNCSTLALQSSNMALLSIVRVRGGGYTVTKG